jgi:1-aminocyclopropane-1-carboxylate deaminase/D-cysteine desulfhydrase-like pyridoxal-dependent ACC family enzyme
VPATLRAERLRSQGRHPYEIPLGASTPLGALGFARAWASCSARCPRPDVIVHASASGGTQAGLLAAAPFAAYPRACSASALMSRCPCWVRK